MSRARRLGLVKYFLTVLASGQCAEINNGAVDIDYRTHSDGKAPNHKLKSKEEPTDGMVFFLVARS